VEQKKTITIFLTDDDPDERFLFEEALSLAYESVRYLFAFDGVDALEKLQSSEMLPPDLIFLDVNMPRMNGIDCLKQIKSSEKLKSIPVIMYSTSSYYQPECIAHGASHYLEKPNDFSQLCDTLKFILTEGFPLSKGYSS